MYFHLTLHILWQGKAIGQAGLSNRLGIRCQSYSTTRTTVVGIDAPFRALRSCGTIVVLSLHSHIAIGGGSEGVAARRRIDGNSGSPWQYLLTEVIVPRGIADMLLNHHTVPLAISHHLIIILAQLGIATKGLLDLLGPLVGISKASLSCILVHGLRVIHIIEVCHSLHGEQQHLSEGIARRCGHIFPQTKDTGLQRHIVVSHTLPLACLNIICSSIEHLRSHTCHILAVLIVDVSSLSNDVFGSRTAEHRTEESLGMVGDILKSIFFRVPGHIHKQRDRILHRFQVANIQNPHTLDAVVVGQRELFEHLLSLGDIQPLCVTWCTYIVDVVVKSPTTLMFAFLSIGYTSHITPVVVAQQHDDVIRHTHTCIIVVEHFLIQCPNLRSLLGRLLSHLLDNLTLVLYNLL